MKPQKLLKLKGTIYLKGYEMKEFAKEISIDPKTLSAIISGRLIPSVELQIRISKILGKSKNFLFTGV